MIIFKNCAKNLVKSEIIMFLWVNMENMAIVTFSNEQEAKKAKIK